ncbi:MAG TPA: V-type ATP synthase subunit D [Rectinemataceae bacterium]
MAKVKLTKNELKKKKDALKMYRRYLPTLQLKKQQLQVEIRAVEARHAQLMAAKSAIEVASKQWIAVFSEESAARNLHGKPYLRVESIDTSSGNIAGVVIPVYEGTVFAVDDYDLYLVPLWVDKALETLKSILELDAEASIVARQRELLSRELRVTTQRVNLFEKVKIPETVEDIKRIGIYLGDQQTAQVVRGKIAKRKVEEVGQ